MLKSWHSNEGRMIPNTTDATSHSAMHTSDMKAIAFDYLVQDRISDVTVFEEYSDIVLGVAFLLTALVAAKRMYVNSRLFAGTIESRGNDGQGSSGGGAETTVVTAFYSLILATALLRSMWFLIPSFVWHPHYTPVALYAFETTDTSPTEWIGYTLSELVVTIGSLTLFSIFILILVYWADILKKYYNPGCRRTLPMTTFISLVLTLIGLEILNLLLFLFGRYSTEGMILFNAVLLAVVSIVCVCQITIFSKKFQNVLITLGAINQVSTDSQIKRIVWITVTGNLFFFSRALLETVFAGILLVYYLQYQTINKVFTHSWWDTYTLLKYWSELIILALMLHILQSRFNGGENGGRQRDSVSDQPSQSNSVGYTKVPDATVNV